jgi:hypothetical protein
VRGAVGKGASQGWSKGQPLRGVEQRHSCRRAHAGAWALNWLVWRKSFGIPVGKPCSSVRRSSRRLETHGVWHTRPVVPPRASAPSRADSKAPPQASEI